MITKTTIRAYGLTTATVQVLEAAGCSDATVAADFISLRDDDGAALLASCLDGADDDAAVGWREYVNCLVVESDHRRTYAQR
jgi:hypothetical protein